MVNAETGKVIDLLESRDTDKVTEWLKKFPNIEIVSRDGSTSYAKAIRDAKKNIIQISDRFHLLKNISQYAKDFIKHSVPPSILIEREEVEGCAEELPGSHKRRKYDYKMEWELIMAVQEERKNGKTISEIASSFRIGNKTVMKYEKITEDEKGAYENKPLIKEKVSAAYEHKVTVIGKLKSLLEAGYTKPAAAKILGISTRTVTRYVNSGFRIPAGSLGQKRSSILDGYKKEILGWHEKGLSSNKIYEKLRETGYKGSASKIRAFLTPYNQGKRGEADEKIKIPLKQITSLIYNKVNEKSEITPAQLEQVYKKYPQIKQVLDVVYNFKEALFSGDKNQLDGWIKSAKEMDINEINSFIKGVEQDIDAVKNAIIYPYSNGLAEGTVNKIKVIKRIMYGRNKFDMLKRKVLSHLFN